MRLLVIAVGMAPEQTKFRAASATAIIAPCLGSRYTKRPLQSVVAAIALSVPRIRITPESPPGRTAVDVLTVVSYW